MNENKGGWRKMKNNEEGWRRTKTSKGKTKMTWLKSREEWDISVMEKRLCSLSVESSFVPCCLEHHTDALGRQKHEKAHDPSPHPSHLGKHIMGWILIITITCYHL